MRYFDYLTSNKNEFVTQIEHLFTKYKVQPVGSGYIDCIVMKNNLEEFIKELTALGILISDVSWWCYVNPNNETTECPHGMGGPKSTYYEGWFSELQNDFFEADSEKVNSILNSYDKQSINALNIQTIDGIKNMLNKPFKYTPTDYIQCNKCVMPGVWLLVPEDWERN
ncbi:hypothetical protein [Bacillus sp. X1(2014)]|uniref:hypothetical protein n=1 Tax=Bacillus sp. X1(2014) TaxID=1565991 RepID=UPI0011A6E2E4|nr:hypothetical protein [Bacillus sp. X1(2014)]